MLELAVFILMNGLVFGGAALVARHGLKFRDGISIVLTTALIGWVAVVVGLELLATVGWIRLAPALLLAAFVFAAGACCWWRSCAADVCDGGDESLSVAARVAAPLAGGCSVVVRASLVLAGVLVAWAMLDVLASALCNPVLAVSDAPIYHLYFAVKWWQTGRLAIVPTPFGESAAPYFPANGDVWFTWLVLPWSSELLAKVGQWPFLPLATAAVYGLARELDVRRESAAVPALLWGAGTLQLLHAGMADVDLVMAAWILTATWFLVRYWREHRLPQIVAAGLACGAALGTKYVAMLFVPWLVLAALAFAWRARSRWQHLVALSASVAAPAAFWFVRNAWLTGNPVYPLHVELFGVPVFKGWYTRATLFTSDYHIPTNEWPSFLLILLRGADPTLAVFWLSGVIAAIGAALRGRWLAVLFIGLACLHFVLFWGVNPYQTQDRFLFAAFALAAVPIALVFDRWPLLSVPLVVLFGVHLVVGPAALARILEQQFGLGIGGVKVPLLSAVVPLVRGDLTATTALRGRIVLLVAVAASAAAILIGFRFRGVRLRLIAGAVTLLLLAAGTAFRATQLLTLIPAGPFRFYPVAPQIGYTAGWLALDELSRRPVRVAYAGTNLPFYLFGRRLDNQVRYVNINGHAEFLMHNYHAEFASRGERLAANSTPDWDRREADEAAWLSNIRDQRIELLFIGFTNAAGGEHNFYDADGFAIERTWADRHPEMLRLLYADQRTRLYAVRAP